VSAFPLVVATRKNVPRSRSPSARVRVIISGTWTLLCGCGVRMREWVALREHLHPESCLACPSRVVREELPRLVNCATPARYDGPPGELRSQRAEDVQDLVGALGERVMGGRAQVPVRPGQAMENGGALRSAVRSAINRRAKAASKADSNSAQAAIDALARSTPCPPDGCPKLRNK